MLDPEAVAQKVTGKLPFVCVSITFDDATLAPGAAAPDGWADVVAAHSLVPL